MRRFVVLVVAVLTLLALTLPAAGAKPNSSSSTDQFDDLKLDTPITASAADKIASLANATGSATLSVRLNEPAVAQGGSMAAVETQQAAFLAGLDGTGAEVLGSVQKVLNAVFVQVGAALLPDLAMDGSVYSIKEVGNYELDLTETVPYIGAEYVQSDLRKRRFRRRLCNC